MAKEIGIKITSIVGVAATADGSEGWVKFTSGPTEVILAASPDILLQLVQSVATAAAQARENSGVHGKRVHPVERWEFGLLADGTVIVMSFRLPGGAEFTFQISRDHLPHMRAALDAMDGPASYFRPAGTSRQ